MYGLTGAGVFFSAAAYGSSAIAKLVSLRLTNVAVATKLRQPRKLLLQKPLTLYSYTSYLICMSPFKHGDRGNPNGRPLMPADEKRVRLTVTVAPETSAWLRDRATTQEVSQGAIIDRLVKAKRDTTN